MLTLPHAKRDLPDWGREAPSCREMHLHDSRAGAFRVITQVPGSLPTRRTLLGAEEPMDTPLYWMRQGAVAARTRQQLARQAARLPLASYATAPISWCGRIAPCDLRACAPREVRDVGICPSSTLQPPCRTPPRSR